MSHPTNSAAEQFFQDNPYRLPEEYGHVWKCEIFRAVKLNSNNFRRLIQVACDGDVKFAERYKPYRSKRIIPIKIAEEVIKIIIDNDKCVVTFYRKESV